MNNELYHHGILGQKWGVRRYQNPDGSLTPAGMRHQKSLELHEKGKELYEQTRMAKWEKRHPDEDDYAPEPYYNDKKYIEYENTISDANKLNKDYISTQTKMSAMVAGLLTGPIAHVVVKNISKDENMSAQKRVAITLAAIGTASLAAGIHANVSTRKEQKEVAKKYNLK